MEFLSDFSMTIHGKAEWGRLEHHGVAGQQAWADLGHRGRPATGTVFINQTQNLSPFAAFGGHKKSGLGSEGGMEGLLEYTNPQTFIRPKSA